VLALLAGISRSSVTTVGGLWGGLDHEDAARFTFLLATPPILAAGVPKLPSLGHVGPYIHGQVAVAFMIISIPPYLPARYFRTRTLTPFANHRLLAGLASMVRFAPF
jgi:undecaprenyl-diphosphatase